LPLYHSQFLFLIQNYPVPKFLTLFQLDQFLIFSSETIYGFQICLSFRFSIKTLYKPLFYPLCATCTAVSFIFI